VNKQIIAAMILTLSLTCLVNAGELKGIDFVRSVEKFDFIINSGEKSDGLTSKIIEIASRLAVLHLDWEFRFSGN
jgi:hypothetical protein